MFSEDGRFVRENMSSDNFVTPSQLAAKYPVSRSTIYSACRAGLVTHFRVPSRKGSKGKYVIRESDFLAWLDRNKHEAGAPAPASATPVTPTFRHLKL